MSPDELDALQARFDECEVERERRRRRREDFAIAFRGTTLILGGAIVLTYFAMADAPRDTALLLIGVILLAFGLGASVALHRPR